MTKRLLAFAGAAIVLVTAIVLILALLNVMSFADMRESLGRVVGVIAVAAFALAAITWLLRVASVGRR